MTLQRLGQDVRDLRALTGHDAIQTVGFPDQHELQRRPAGRAPSQFGERRTVLERV